MQAVSVTDDLATVLFATDLAGLSTAAVTARITREVVAWARARGWAARTEARVDVPTGQTPTEQLGFVDVVVRRADRMPDLAIEIDSADKPWSVIKLQHAAAAGMHAIWVRWGTRNGPASTTRSTSSSCHMRGGRRTDESQGSCRSGGDRRTVVGFEVWSPPPVSRP